MSHRNPKTSHACRAVMTAIFSLIFVASAPGMPRPNIVLIVTDDQRFTAMHCLGNPFLITPNMDRIRNEGVHFRNAFVTTSLCSPSRASILTGTYAHTHGVMTNDENDLDPARTPTFPQILKENAGYRTAFIGKWHQRSSDDTPRPGFDYWLSFKGHGVYTDCPMNENGAPVATKGYITDVLTDRAVNWISDAAGSGKPFCLVLCHKAPHQPFTPSDRDVKAYAGVTLPVTPDYHDSLAGKPAWQRDAGSKTGVRRSSSGTSSPVLRAFSAARDRRITGDELLYYRCLNGIDTSVGRVLDELDRTGVSTDTVVLYLGDNGMFWGEHSRGDKRLAYEEAMRIPMIMRYPALIKPGSTLQQMVLNIDLAPTLLDLAGVTPPAHMQGRSALPLIKGTPTDWRKSFLYEYFIDLTPEIPRIEGVRTDRWKYVTSPDIKDVDELYDLGNDPWELKNEIANPDLASTLTILRAELSQLKTETGFRTPPHQDTCALTTGTVLDLALENATSTAIPSRMPHGVGAKLLQGADITNCTGEGPALRCSGNPAAAVDKCDAIDPTNCAWTIRVRFRADADGVVAAQGGGSLGYAVIMEKGRPVFAVRNGPSLSVCDGAAPCTGKWVDVVGTIADRTINLYVDGTHISSLSILTGFPKCPNDPLNLGGDGGSAVAPELTGNGFKGHISRFSLHRGQLNQKQIKALCHN